jgi:hypothetical protein
MKFRRSTATCESKSAYPASWNKVCQGGETTVDLGGRIRAVLRGKDRLTRSKHLSISIPITNPGRFFCCFAFAAISLSFFIFFSLVYFLKIGNYPSFALTLETRRQASPCPSSSRAASVIDSPSFDRIRHQTKHHVCARAFRRACAKEAHGYCDHGAWTG